MATLIDLLSQKKLPKLLLNLNVKNHQVTDQLVKVKNQKEIKCDY